MDESSVLPGFFYVNKYVMRFGRFYYPTSFIHAENTYQRHWK